MTASLRPTVEVEEEIYSHEDTDNGSGPMWCHGSTTMVRVGRELFVTGFERIPERKPLNNARWLLFHRSDDGPGWELLHRDAEHRTREPSPMACFPDGRFFISVNPSLLGSTSDSYGGPSEPQILEFSVDGPTDGFRTERPEWEGSPPFDEHSYRSFVADGGQQELLLIQYIHYDGAWWSFRDRDGVWSAQGKLDWKFETEYPNPHALRICYPTVTMVDRAVHFFGVNDINEPYPEWRAYKKEITGRDWDFDFRRLFYTWTPDITRKPFREWVEVASRDKTCGWQYACDIRVAPDGLVHLLWWERSLDVRLREEFFPGEKLTISLVHSILREGSEIHRRTLAVSGEDLSGPEPTAGRFHITADDRLLVVAGFKRGETPENCLFEIHRDNAVSDPVKLDLERPFPTWFFTSSPRAGSLPSSTLDMLGTSADDPKAIQYCRIALED